MRQRQAQADHIGRVAVDALDEPAAEPVEGEGTGDLQWLTGGEVGREVGWGGAANRTLVTPRGLRCERRRRAEPG